MYRNSYFEIVELEANVHHEGHESIETADQRIPGEDCVEE